MLKSILISFLISFTFSASAQYYGWSKSIGGSGADTCSALAIDKQANLYAIGSFSGSGDFSNDTIKDNITSNGNDDIFIQKRNKKGKYLWTKKIGGKGHDRPNSMIYYNNALYISGSFEDTLDFGIQKIIPKGKRSIFLAKLDTAGKCIWVKTLGDTLYSRARSLAINKDGIYLSGEFSGVIEQIKYQYTMFVQKTDFEGNVNWTKMMVTKRKDINANNNIRSVVSNSLALDSLGFIYNVGNLLKDNVDFNPSAINDSILSTNGLSDIFIQKLNSNGEFVWVKKIGGTSNDEANTIITKGNDFYIAGYFSSKVNFDPNSTLTSNLNTLTEKGNKDIFIGKYNLNGKFVWIKQIGGAKEENAKQLEIDKYNNIYLVGSYNTISNTQTDFLGKSLKPSVLNDVFLLKFDVQGKGISAEQISGSGADYGSVIKADTMKNVYVGGSYSGNMTITGAIKPFVSNGSSDIFIYKSLLTKGSDSILNEYSNSSLIENFLNFKIYPNPVQNTLHLSFDYLPSNAHLIITNVSGQSILKKELVQGQMEDIITLDHLTSGIYFVKLDSEYSNYTYKINKL